MAIIYSYPIVDPSANDLVLGSDVDSPGKATKNFTVQSIIDLVTVSGNDLQAVLDNGNTATNKDINITNNAFRGASFISVGGITLNGTTGSGFTSITSTDFTGTLQTAAQPNITSLGTLTSLKVGNNTPAITSLVTSFTAPGDDIKLATTKAIVDYVGTNPPGAESLAATLLVGNTTGSTNIVVQKSIQLPTTTTNTGTPTDQGVLSFGGDFQNGNRIFNDTSGGTLRIQGSSNLNLFAPNHRIHNSNGDLIQAGDTGVRLYYQNSQKLTTTNTGVSITGNTVATGSGTFVNIFNTGYYSDSSGDVGSAGQILSSTGSGTNWINDPNPTPYTWIIEADSGAGSPYTVQTGDTIDFVGVGNVDTAWDNSSKELRISLGGTSISGTGADTQVVYWTGAQTVSGDAGMVYNDTSNNLTVSGTVQAGTLSDGTFSGSGGTYTGGVSITSTDFVGDLTGNADTATALASAGTIQLLEGSGATQGVGSNAVTYTSGGNVQLTTSLASTVVTAKVLTNLPSPTSSAITASDTILAAMAKLQGQITGIPQGLVYKGTWNANTNTPTLASGTGTTGEFYIVSVAGSTNLDGITDWQVGDWAIFVEVGATDTWQKIDNSQSITGSGATNKIARWTAPTVLGTGLIEDDGTTVTIGTNGNLTVQGDTILGDNAAADTVTLNGPTTFESTGIFKVGIGLGAGPDYGSAGQVLTSGGGSGAANTWTTPTTGTVTSVATNNGLTGGTITTTGTLGILTVGTSNAIEFLSAATPASGDFVWFSDINDSNTLRKCTVADLQGPIGGPFLPLAGGTMTGNILRGDNISDFYGAGNDLQIRHTGSASFISNFNTNLIIDQEANDADIIFRCDDGSGGVTAYITLDGSDPKTIFSKPTRHIDSIPAYFGSGDDMFVRHTGSEGNIKNSVGNLYISQDANDADIIFENDNGSGGLATYLTIDGGDENIQFSKNGKFLDNVKALFGNSNDLQIYHDGNNSKITEGGTGGLYIGSSLLGIQNNDHTEMMAQFTENGAVELYYDNSKKFETTTGGVSVTGSLSVSTTSSLVGDVSVGDTNSAFIGMLRAGANYIAATNAAGTLIFRTGGTTPAVTIDANQNIKFDDYGSGNNTGTPTYNLEVDSSGNIIETPSLNPGGKGGVYTGNKSFTGGAAAATLFRLTRGTTGALVFDVYLTSGTSQYSVKKFTVAHILNTTPTFNKIIDSGFTTNGDYTVAFVNDGQGVSGDTVKCTIAATTTQDIYYTVVVGHGATAVTRHTS